MLIFVKYREIFCFFDGRKNVQKNITIFGIFLDFWVALCYSFDKESRTIHNGEIFFENK